MKFLHRAARGGRHAGAAITVSLTVLASVCAAPASAATIPDPTVNPSANFPATFTLPASCLNDAGTGAACLDASIDLLNAARQNLGQPAYALPSNFLTLSADQQMFVLTDLDRALYGLAPITGITDDLSQAAMAGVDSDTDPDPLTVEPDLAAYASNWAGGYPNALLAYEGWMYDDGPGSDNLDCTAADPSGCWGHRENVLDPLTNGSGPTAGGFADGTDPSGSPGYAMDLVGSWSSSATPTYTYTWAQAVAAGANGGVSDVPVAPSAPTATIPTTSSTATSTPVSTLKPTSIAPVAPKPVTTSTPLRHRRRRAFERMWQRHARHRAHAARARRDA